jgi:hypothetical protein
VREATGLASDAFGEGEPGVELTVPAVKVDLGQKGVDRRFVREELAEQQPGVPLDHDAADVEDNGVNLTRLAQGRKFSKYRLGRGPT